MTRGISNRIFLEAMFEDMAPGTHTIICGFPGDPYTADRGGWAGRPWQPGDRVADWHALNTYLTVSAFHPDMSTGECRRRKADFAAMFTIMIDDVGTKVTKDKVLLSPTAIIETSPGNFQAFYFLRQDAQTRDREVCERIVDRMVKAGLAVDSRDPGMKGVTRYCRLPEGINGKAKYVQQLGHAFQVRCRKFEPTLRYTIDDIAKAYGLDMRPDEKPARTVVQFSEAQARNAANTFIDLIRLLESMGMYKARISTGPWHDITCPWIDSHTNGADSGAAISDPSAANNFACGFRCHHGHCEGKKMVDVWRWARSLMPQQKGQRA